MFLVSNVFLCHSSENYVPSWYQIAQFSAPSNFSTFSSLLINCNYVKIISCLITSIKYHLHQILAFMCFLFRFMFKTACQCISWSAYCILTLVNIPSQQSVALKAYNRYLNFMGSRAWIPNEGSPAGDACTRMVPSLCHKINAIFYLDNLISLEENIRQCPVAR